MAIERETISRLAQERKKEYEFLTELEILMGEKPGFVQRLEEYLMADGATTKPPVFANGGAKKIDVIVDILRENKDWMSSKHLTEAAEERGFAVASQNLHRAFSSALSAEKRKKSRSRIVHYKRKWGLAEWEQSDIEFSNDHESGELGWIAPEEE